MTAATTSTPLRRRVVSALVLVVAVTSAPYPVAAGAAEPSTLAEPPVVAGPGQRQQLEEDLEAATAEEQRLASELAAADAERRRLASLLAEVSERTSGAADALDVADARLGRATAELAGAQARLAATERSLGAALADLRAQAVESFIVGGHGGAVSAFTAAEDLRELAAASTYREVVLEHQDEVVHRVERLRDDVAERERAAEDAKTAATSAVESADRRRRTLEAERSELEVLQQASAQAVLTHATLLQEVSTRRAGYEQQLAALVQVSDSIAAALAARQVGQTADAAVAGTLLLPVPTARLSSTFGPRVHPIFGTSRLHAGIDLAAPTGTPIGVAGAGTVVTAGVLGGYGNVVVVEHGRGLSTLYGHLSRIHVQPGDVVQPGQTIGLVGSTGNSTGPHLHLEVRLFGTPVDPLAYL